METLLSCPLCGQPSPSGFMDSRDFFLTQEEFSVSKCSNCGLLFTNPRPEKDELGRYYESKDYISHDTGENNLFNLAYKGAREISLMRKLRLVKMQSAGNRILDIGCGTGEFLKKCRSEGYEVTGIEPNEKAAGYARAMNGIPVFAEDHLENLESQSFDVITLWHVLEHVADLNERMRTVHRLLKETGTAIIAVPNAGSWDALYYGKFWAAWDLPRHLYHFTIGSFSHLARKNFFTILQVLPMKMDAFYISMLSEKYRKGRPDIFSAFINGIRSNRSATRNAGYSSLIFVMKTEIGPK